MKEFEVKTTELKGENGLLNYADLVRMVLNNPPKDGFSPEEMSARLDVLKKFKDIKVTGKERKPVTVSLENAECSKLADCSRNMRWNTVSEDLKRFSDYVADLA